MCRPCGDTAPARARARPDAVGDLPPLSRTASLATALGRQTGVPVRARPGLPRAIADWYITVRGGPPPLRQGGPFSLPGKITNVTIFHEPVRCSRCPIEPGLPCAGRGVRRLCELVDPAHPAYNPACRRQAWVVAHPGPPQIRARQLTHTAPRSTFVTRYPLLFRGHVHGFRCTRHVSLQRSVETASPSPAGSFGQVPPPQRYYGTLRLPAAHLAALRFLRLAIPSFVPCSSPPTRDRAVDQPGVGKPGLQAGSHDGDGRVSQVPERPSCPCACSWTPVGPKYASHCGALARPPLVSTTVAPASRRFRGSIARHWDSLSTLRNGGRPPPRKTRFRLLAKLCRAGFVNPQGCNERFPSSISSPFLELT